MDGVACHDSENSREHWRMGRRCVWRRLGACGKEWRGKVADSVASLVCTVVTEEEGDQVIFTIYVGGRGVRGGNR